MVSASSFIPRTRFLFPNAVVRSWQIGHMTKATRQLATILPKVELLIEVRDARVPLTSCNMLFENLVPKRVRRLIVLNKRELADPRLEPAVERAFSQLSRAEVRFLNARSLSEIKTLLKKIMDMGAEAAERRSFYLYKDNWQHRRSKKPPPEEDEDNGVRIMVVGMPNVGKSTIINALRHKGVHKGKAVRTGADPGVTRRIHQDVRISMDPPIYLMDSPGIMPPFLGGGVGGAEAAMKVALTSGVREHLLDVELLADYLLFRLNLRCQRPNTDFSYEDVRKLFDLPQDAWPTNEINDFLTAIAMRRRLLLRGGEPDINAAALVFIQSLRDGKLGRWTLDDFGKDFKAPTFDRKADLRKQEKERAKWLQTGAAQRFKLGTSVISRLPPPARLAQLPQGEAQNVLDQDGELIALPSGNHEISRHIGVPLPTPTITDDNLLVRTQADSYSHLSPQSPGIHDQVFDAVRTLRANVDWKVLEQAEKGLQIKRRWGGNRAGPPSPLKRDRKKGEKARARSRRR